MHKVRCCDDCDAYIRMPPCNHSQSTNITRYVLSNIMQIAALCPHPILSTDRPFCPVHIKVALLNNTRAPFFSQSVPYLEQAAACSQPHPLHLSDRGWLMFLPALSPASPCLVSPRKHSWLVNSWKRTFAKTEKAPTRTFSWLKAPANAFTFKTLLRQY